MKAISSFLKGVAGLGVTFKYLSLKLGIHKE